MELRMEEQLTVPTFRSILFKRLEAQGISRDIGETVLEEITITTAIYMHQQRKAERAALDAAKRMGRVVHLEPGASSTPLVDKKPSTTPAKKELPPAVEL